MEQKKIELNQFENQTKNQVIEEMLQGTVKGGCCLMTITPPDRDGNPDWF